ncbi:hypothetical protein BV898_11311 [Hypsibius exemplaris]|uniref:Uncharacterized protein n=1 Tax=Hypsibius exemplaris TaxID=2072580 RepID=A0A1W0WGZ4_HYPEX|nr:hypothetical protein BV898_11311 [Hypsibius exemplaris]
MKPGDLPQVWRTVKPLRPTTKILLTLVSFIVLTLMLTHYSVHRPSVDRPSVDRPSVDRPSVDRPSVGRPLTADPPGEMSAAAENRLSEGMRYYLPGIFAPKKQDESLVINRDQRTVRLDRPVTVVTAYYKIPSKHKSTEYDEWIGNFLPTIPCHLYVFTDEASVARVTDLRGPFMNRTKIIVIPFSELIEAKRMKMYQEQHRMDHENGYQTPQVYVVWNEKVHFLMKSIQDNVFDSDFFLWTDSGCFRDAERTKLVTTFPDTKTTLQLLGTKKVFFLEMGAFMAEDRKLGANGLPLKDFRYDVRLAATIFGGHVSALRMYDKRYYETMELMRKEGRFIGKEQNIMSSVAVMYPELVKLVKPRPYLDGDQETSRKVHGWTKIIVLPFADLIEAKRMAMYKEQHAVDSEKSYHTPEVYIVWNEKIHFLMKAIQDNVFDSDYFMWTDIGCFRDPWRATQLTTYPDTNTTSLLLGRDRVYFLQMGNFAKTDHTLAANGVPIKDFRYEVRLGGTMFGGHASALIKYDKLFYSTMELMLKDGRFIGKDQNIMSSIAMMHPELVKRVRPESYLNGGDPWFYTQYYFSKRPLTTEDIQKESQD